MPFYNDLRPQSDFEDRDFERVCPDMDATEKQRTITGLKRLREMLAKSVQPRRTEQNLLVASWNIQNFGYGERHGESLYYIAEILSVFDLIAVQEITNKLADLNKVMRILGPNWSYTYTDPARGPGSGDESSAYLYNTDRVRPTGLSGELSVWSAELEAALGDDIDDDTRSLTRFAAQRPPHIVGFTTRWKSFSLINLHLQPSDTRAAGEQRLREVELVLAALAANADMDWAERTILVGDMNFYKGRDEPTIELLHAAGYWESSGLVGQTTNVPHRDDAGNLRDGHIFDRMFFSRSDTFRMTQIEQDDGTFRDSGGVVPVFEAIMREDDWPTYLDLLVAKQRTTAKKEEMRTDPVRAKSYFSETWRDWQISDHLPIWVELDVDDTNSFLDSNHTKIGAEMPGA